MTFYSNSSVLARLVILTLGIITTLLISVNKLSARDWDKSASIPIEAKMVPKDDSVTLIPAKPNYPDGLQMDFEANGGGYPGVQLIPLNGKFWNLSDFTCLEVTVTSMSPKPIYLTVRVDNPTNMGAKPWNSGAVRLVDGDTKTIRVFFGFGPKGPGFDLDKSKVSQILVFTSKASEGQSVRIDSIRATKRPIPFKPDVIPLNDVILSDVEESPAKKYVSKNGAVVKGGKSNEPLLITFNGPEQSVAIKPEGDALWDFKGGYRIVAVIRNVGSEDIMPGLQATSKKGNTKVATPEGAIAGGQRGQIELSFIKDEPSIIDPKTKKKFFDSNDTQSVVILANGVSGQQEIEVESIHLDAPAVTLPDWVGKRPPVDGDWEITFQEEFDGDSLDRSTWNVITPNFWDKISRFSKDNVKVEDGRAVLIFEKRPGYHGDDPKHPRYNQYTTGFLDTYGKWVQRYGYYEARMKLPTENGLWPAFWLMPDRGLDAGEQWRRASIDSDAMEFDIMEYLSGWGPHRFTTAFHWDGYGKNHKATGAGTYTAYDEDGYITTGLLWLPGLAVVYNNGQEITRWETDRISTIESNIIFTFVGGGWDNTGINDKELPATFEIDYVRVWQRADLASDVDGVQSTQETLAAPTAPDE